MATNTFQVILSTDGKHTVIASTDEFRLTAQAETWAKATYDKIAERYGLKGAARPNGSQAASGRPSSSPSEELGFPCGHLEALDWYKPTFDKDESEDLTDQSTLMIRNYRIDTNVFTV